MDYAVCLTSLRVWCSSARKSKRSSFTNVTVDNSRAKIICSKANSHQSLNQSDAKPGTQSFLNYPSFPALWAVSIVLLWVLIGSYGCLLVLWYPIKRCRYKLLFGKRWKNKKKIECNFATVDNSRSKNEERLQLGVENINSDYKWMTRNFCWYRSKPWVTSITFAKAIKHLNRFLCYVSRTDTFYRDASPVGHLKTIKVHRDNSGFGPYWKLARVSCYNHYRIFLIILDSIYCAQLS